MPINGERFGSRRLQEGSEARIVYNYHIATGSLFWFHRVYYIGLYRSQFSLLELQQWIQIALIPSQSRSRLAVTLQSELSSLSYSEPPLFYSVSLTGIENTSQECLWLEAAVLLSALPAIQLRRISPRLRNRSCGELCQEQDSMLLARVLGIVRSQALKWMRLLWESCTQAPGDARMCPPRYWHWEKKNCLAAQNYIGKKIRSNRSGDGDRRASLDVSPRCLGQNGEQGITD